jgi:peptidoglycan/LPS O-acetylase OafA/YrhL
VALLAFGLVRRARGRIAVGQLTIAVMIPLWDQRMLHSVHYIVLLLGSLLAVVMHHRRGFAVIRPLLSPLGSLLFGGPYHAVHRQRCGLLQRFGEPRVIPFFGLAVCLLLPTVIGPGLTRWLLSLRPMAFVGQRSYSLYLVQAVAHSAAVGLVPAIATQPSPLGGLATWVVGVLFADLLFRWVEQPLIRVGRSVSGRGRSGRDPGAHGQGSSPLSQGSSTCGQNSPVVVLPAPDCAPEASPVRVNA